LATENAVVDRGGGSNGSSGGDTVRNLVLLGFATAMLLVSGSPAAAVPRPLSKEELEEQSDLVASAHVTCVTREPNPVGRDGSRMTYQAWLQIGSVRKGDVKEGETVVVRWSRDVSRVAIGDWFVEYSVGEIVLTHLVWVPEDRVYRTTWWNAKRVIDERYHEPPTDCPGASKN
jgi:hypothetical protein